MRQEIRVRDVVRTHDGRFGVRVPNPCSERDMKGRDLDKVGRNLRPGDKLTDETVDRILSDPESV